jgi:hypothetical protein
MSGLINSNYEDDEIINGLTYYYRISAFDTHENQSQLSNEVSAVFQSDDNEDDQVISQVEEHESSINSIGNGGGSNHQLINQIKKPIIMPDSASYELDNENEIKELNETNNFLPLNEDKIIVSLIDSSENLENIVGIEEKNIYSTSNEDISITEYPAKTEDTEDPINNDNTELSESKIENKSKIENTTIITGIKIKRSNQNLNTTTNLETPKILTKNNQYKLNCIVPYYGSEEEYIKILNVHNLDIKDSLYFDLDMDSLDALSECEYKTNPLLSDSDWDGISDG